MNRRIIPRLIIPRLLAISDLTASKAQDDARKPQKGLEAKLAAWIGLLFRHGITAIQLREKALTDDRLYALTRFAMAQYQAAQYETAQYETAHDTTTNAPQVTVLVNSRADIALAAGASGVHLPVASLPVAQLRRQWGERLLIGCSTHNVEEVRRARDSGADFVTFGPVYDTPSKRRYGAPRGLPELRQAAALGLPVIALGGVDAATMASVAEAGAWGVAGIRAFQNSESLVEMARLAQHHWPT